MKVPSDNPYVARQPLSLSTLFACRDIPAVRAWVEQLPAADPERVASELRGAVEQLGMQEMPAKKRFELLEVLIEPLREVVESFSEARRKGLFPLSVVHRRLVSEMLALIPEYLAGYRRILWQGGISRLLDRWWHRKIRSWSAHRLITLLGLMSDAERQMERRQHPGLWAELTRTVQKACDAGWMQLEVPGIFGPRETSTLEWEYGRLVLISHLLPGTLDTRTGIEFMAAMNYWVAGLKRVTPRAGKLPKGFIVGFGTKLAADAPPLAIPLIGRTQGAGAAPRWALLHDAEDLEQELTWLIAEARASPNRRAGAGDAVVGWDTLRLLKQQWFGPELPGGQWAGPQERARADWSDAAEYALLARRVWPENGVAGADA